MLPGQTRYGRRRCQSPNMTAPTTLRVVYRYPVLRQRAGFRLRLFRRKRRYVMSGRAKLFQSCHGYRSFAVSFNSFSHTDGWSMVPKYCGKPEGRGSTKHRASSLSRRAAAGMFEISTSFWTRQTPRSARSVRSRRILARVSMLNMMSISPTRHQPHDVVIGIIVGARIQEFFDARFRRVAQQRRISLCAGT